MSVDVNDQKPVSPGDEAAQAPAPQGAPQGIPAVDLTQVPAELLANEILRRGPGVVIWYDMRSWHDKKAKMWDFRHAGGVVMLVGFRECLEKIIEVEKDMLAGRPLEDEDA